MNDNDRWANTMLANAVGTEPELGFQPDDVLTRARRDIARRRATVTGAATVVALVATGLLVNHHDSGTQRQPAAATQTPTTVQGYGGPMVYDAHGAAMTAALADARLIPPAIRLSTDTYYGGAPLVFYRLNTGQYTNSYYAQATLTDTHGAGHIAIRVMRQQTGLNCVGAPSYWQPCRTTTLPDGSRLTSMRYAPPQSGRPAIQWTVELVRPDGNAVDAMSGNWSLDGDPATGGITHATGAEPPLDLNTLVELVRMPGLTP